MNLEDREILFLVFKNYSSIFEKESWFCVIVYI